MLAVFLYNGYLFKSYSTKYFLDFHFNMSNIVLKYLAWAQLLLIGKPWPKKENKLTLLQSNSLSWFEPKLENKTTQIKMSSLIG